MPLTGVLSIPLMGVFPISNFWGLVIDSVKRLLATVGMARSDQPHNSMSLGTMCSPLTSLASRVVLIWSTVSRVHASVGSGKAADRAAPEQSTSRVPMIAVIVDFK